MKQIRIVFIACLLFAGGLITALPNSASADDVASCDDIKNLEKSIDELNDALEQVPRIRRGSELDRSLEEVVDALELVAQAEPAADLREKTDDLRDAWNEANWREYKEELDRIADELEYLYNQDCR